MNKFIKLSDKLSRPLILNIVRRGMTVLIPMVLASSVAQAIIAFPIPAFEYWLRDLFGGMVYTLLSYIRDFSFSYFSVMLAISISTNYVLEAEEPIETSVFAPPAACLSYLLITRPDLANTAARLGTQSSFWALIISLAATWGYLKLVHSPVGNVFNVTSGHDILYRGAMRSLLPLFIIIACAASFSFFLHDICGISDLTMWLGGILERAVSSLGNGFLEAAAAAFIIHILWFFGIHGSNAMDYFMESHTTVGSNIIFSKTFFDIFVLMGGCGTSICVLTAILISSKNGKMKNFARSAAMPVLLNINEMITFGLPIIWNPILLIPFMLVPLECTAIAYAALKFGLVAPVISRVTWTTPVFLSGYAATHSISGVFLQLLLITVGTLTYIPFIRIYESFESRQMKEQFTLITNELKAAEISGEDVTFMDRTDRLGVAANTLMNDLRIAVKSRLPYLVYQPQFKADGTCIGAEALIRWKHPTGGFIYPPLIIYLAQKGGFLPELEEHIFDMACNAIKQTEAMTGKDFKISVNITARSLKWDGLEDCVANAVARHRVAPERLWIEITEQDVFTRDKYNINKITRLRGKGHKFLIDDFGMGKTSIFYLQSKLFDGVKLDGSLIKTVIDDKTNYEVVSSIIELSDKLNMLVIAEYVETAEICKTLDKMGCDYYQGYYFAKPGDLSEFWDKF